MKKFFHFVVELKSWISLCYTAAMFIFLTISWFVGGRTVEILTLFQILFMTIAITLLQYICFSDHVIKKMRYSRRMLIFVVPMLTIITLCAVWFEWVPSGNTGAWVTFFAAALVCFVLICAGYEFCFWVMGKKYDGLLGEYREKRKKRS